MIEGCVELSGIPKDIPDFGSVATMPTQNPDYVPGSSFTAEDYYVWTRCDGATSLKDIILMVGLGVEKTVAILRKLREAGAIAVPGDASVPTPLEAEGSQPIEERRSPAASSVPLQRPPTAQPVAKRVNRPSANPPHPLTDAGTQPISDLGSQQDLPDLGDLDSEELVAMSSNVEIDETTRARIIGARRNLNNYFALLGVEPGVGKRQLKRAYFRFSKTFHPDKFFGKQLGPFAAWIQEIFETSTRAFNELSDSRRRKAYEARVLGLGEVGPRTQTREEHAEELFERACDHEIGGDSGQALKLFGAACRINPKPAFVSRAARCALQAQKLGLAEDYAKTATSLRPKDPSYARLLADVYRAAGRLDEAESTIMRAIDLNQENDVLMAELRIDLEKVQRARGAKGAR